MSNEIRYHFNDYLENVLKEEIFQEKKEGGRVYCRNSSFLEYHVAEPKFRSI